MTGTTSTTETRIKANLDQIVELRQAREEICQKVLTGETTFDKATEACEAISEQIVELYEEIDAIEEGANVKGHQYPERTDEVKVTPAELAAAKHLGWGREQIIKQKQKMGIR